MLRVLAISFIIIAKLSLFSCTNSELTDDSGIQGDFITYEVDPTQKSLQMYWKNSEGKNFANAKNLKTHLESKDEKLLFAVNGGMYTNQRSAQGLYIEHGKVLAGLDRAKSGYGNFYMQANGVFYLSRNQKPTISATQNFSFSNDIEFATQSGPMLISKGHINKLFGKNSENLNIRNGVGILPNGNVYFVQSTVEVNFYDFAKAFADRGCENALYLDGYVSRTYLPEKKWEQLDGNFGVMIAVSE